MGLPGVDVRLLMGLGMRVRLAGVPSPGDDIELEDGVATVRTTT